MRVTQQAARKKGQHLLRVQIFTFMLMLQQKAFHLGPWCKVKIYI